MLPQRDGAFQGPGSQGARYLVWLATRPRAQRSTWRAVNLGGGLFVLLTTRPMGTTLADTELVPSSGSTGQKRWLLALLVLALFLRLWRLEQNGFGTDYY